MKNTDEHKKIEYKTQEEILIRGNEAIGKTVRQIDKYGRVDSDGIKGGTDIAGAVAGSSKSNKKVEKGTSSKIGNVVGGFIGGLLDKKEAGEQVGEFVGDIAPSVIDAVKDVWTNVTNQNKENEIKLNEFISLMSEEDYRGTLEQFASIMKPNISSIDKLDLNKYLTSGSINLLNKTINKIVK